MISPKKVLPLDAVNAIRVLIHHLVPPTKDLQIDDMDDIVIFNCSRLLNEFQPLFRFGFILGVIFFEWLPFLFGFGLARFSKLSTESQISYMNCWGHSRLAALRGFLKAVKGLAMMAYFSDKRVWKYIGYDPEPHLEERIKMREAMIRKIPT